MNIELISKPQKPLVQIEEFAKVSHNTEPCETEEDTINFIRKLISMGHESVLECIDFTFRISGISRVTTHQLVRHRLASYCQESERYVKMNNECIIPDSIKNTSWCAGYQAILDDIIELYNNMVEDGIPKEDARYILPQAKTTTIMVKMNARELRHFFKLRCDKHAQWEIRNVAIKMLEKSYWVCPVVFEDLYGKYFHDHTDYFNALNDQEQMIKWDGIRDKPKVHRD